LPPTATYDVSLVVAGASAQRDTIQQEVNAICQAGTFNRYLASPATAQDFRAYSCRTLTTLSNPAIADKNIIVYYRSEGGSGWGVAPLVNNRSVKRLLVNAACNAATESCPVTGYNLLTDGITSGNLIDARVELAVSDVEPSRFVGENWPANPGGATNPALGAEPANPSAAFGALNVQTATGTVFGILVNTSVALSDLSRQDVSGIFTGNVADWSQLAQTGAAGIATGPEVAGAITVCRRERGSGTQTAASIYFNGQGCPVGLPFVEGSGPIFGNTVTANTTSSAMNACVAGTPGAIGIQTFTTAPVANTKFVSINGKTPGKIDTAKGDYDFAFESAFSTDEFIAANPGGQALASFLIGRARVASTIPSNDSAFALYNGGVNIPVIPVNTARPIALGTRGGNSCNPMQAAPPF
jgi:hypothetical protein